jgi:hypothetical protein
MRVANARVVESGLPRVAHYMGTYTDGSKHYMEIRYHKRQCRKWVKKEYVTLHEGVELVYCEKITELKR